MPFPGLSQASPVTMEGLYLADLSAVKVLRDWYAECKGQITPTILGGERRDISIIHTAVGPEGNDVLSKNKTLPKQRQFILRDAICTGLTIGDMDENTQTNFATWTIEIQYRDMDVLAQ